MNNPEDFGALWERGAGRKLNIRTLDDVKLLQVLRDLWGRVAMSTENWNATMHANPAILARKLINFVYEHGAGPPHDTFNLCQHSPMRSLGEALALLHFSEPRTVHVISEGELLGYTMEFAELLAYEMTGFPDLMQDTLLFSLEHQWLILVNLSGGIMGYSWLSDAH